MSRVHDDIILIDDVIMHSCHAHFTMIACKGGEQSQTLHLLTV